MENGNIKRTEAARKGRGEKITRKWKQRYYLARLVLKQDIIQNVPTLRLVSSSCLLLRQQTLIAKQQTNKRCLHKNSLFHFLRTRKITEREQVSPKLSYRRSFLFIKTTDKEKLFRAGGGNIFLSAVQGATFLPLRLPMS